MKLDESFIIWAPNAVVTQYNSHTVETNKWIPSPLIK
jgi:hypothetical protein